MNNLLVSQGFYIFNLHITWYGFIIAIGMILGVLSAYLICKKKGFNLSMPLDLALFALPAAIIGARLYYCIFNGVDSFWQIFKIWEGGMAIYGGVIGGFLGVLLCCKIKKYSLLQSCDIAAPCLILGQAIGRIGCYFAGCCYGVETLDPAMQFFPLSVEINGVWHLATFFYEAFFNLIGFAILIIITAKTKTNGYVTAGYFITYGLVRAVLEQFRDPAESLMLGSTGIKVSQLLSILLVLVGIAIIVFNIVKKKKAEKVNG
ncbi:MAG: prolipoprotein diacylglyceryl transferase [Clostridia bacterium]|nr:prolipoprotein diacylglyceryl transferase [Clostridia bacterium]